MKQPKHVCFEPMRCPVCRLFRCIECMAPMWWDAADPEVAERWLDQPCIDCRSFLWSPYNEKEA